VLKKIKEKHNLFKSKFQTIEDIRNKGFNPIGVIEQYIQEDFLAVTVILIETGNGICPYGIARGDFLIDDNRLLNNDISLLGVKTKEEAIKEYYNNV